MSLRLASFLGFRVRTLLACAALLCVVVALPSPASAGTGRVRRVAGVASQKYFLDFCVSIRFNATPQQITEIKRGLTDGSAVLLDATDGQFEFGNISIVNNSGASDEAELWIHPVPGRAFATWGDYGVPGQHITEFYPDNFSKFPTQLGDAVTIAHEFVHHVWGIGDEYHDGSGVSGTAECEPPPGSPLTAHCLMDNYWIRGGNAPGGNGTITLNELCVNSNHDPDGDTSQEIQNGRSCWATLAGHPTRGGAAPLFIPVAAAPAPTPPTFVTLNCLKRLVLVFDRSASMALRDGGAASPTRLTLAKQAAGILIDRMKEHDELAVVSFGDDASVNLALTSMTAAAKTSAKSALNALVAGGGKAIGAGLERVLSMIDPLVLNFTCCQQIVLFTNGENTAGVSELSVIPRLVAANISVIPVAIGTGVNAANLAKLARETSGKFYQATNTAKLPALLAAISAEVTGGGIMARQPGFIGTGQTVNRTVLVDSATQELSATLTTDPANAMALRLVSPTGEVFSATSGANVEFMATAGSMIGMVRRPTLTSGTWTIRVVGQTVVSNAYDVSVSGLAPGVAVAATSDKSLYTFPAPALITATPHFEQAVINAVVKATVVTPLGTTQTSDLFDDGLASHGDRTANDGQYSALYGNYSAGPGAYQFDIAAEGVAGSKAHPGESLFARFAPPNSLVIPPFRRETSVTIVAAGVSADDFDGDGLTDAWETKFGFNAGSTTGVDGAAGDPDGDGVSNLAEFQNGTDPTLSNVWALSEGATGFFSERIAIANPHTDAATFSITYLREAGAPIVVNHTLAGERRMTIDVNAIAGLSNTAVSAVVNTTKGGVVVERTMAWDARDGSYYGGHTGKAVQSARTQWFLAEGEARFFDTYILLANANTAVANVRATYLLESGAPVIRDYTVGAGARVTIHANSVPGVAGNAFSTNVTSDIPIAVERAMYFGSAGGRLWHGGHESAAVSAASTSWFIAEGRTGPFFDMYLLLANPGAAATVATIRYLLPGGNVVQQTYNLAPTSRTTVRVDGIAGLADTDVSASITAPAPIIVERAMYWPDPFTSWYEAHNSSGVTTTGVEWALAEGEHGGTLGVESYVLLANPGTVDALVTLNILRVSANPTVVTKVVPANSRVTVPSSEFGLSSGERFGVRVNSDQPIVVERAMYWNALGQFWSAGTNETAVKIR